jgi:ribosomal protein S18 acetylase RimI-like enzyme
VRPQLLNTTVRELTMVARRAGTGEMVGAVLSEDGASDASPDLERVGERFAMVGSILGRLGELAREAAPLPGETLHIFLLGVADGSEGQGVGTALVAACVENGARKGYRRAVAECTGRASQHIFRKLGFLDRAMVPYADHEFNGRRIFAGIAEHGGPILMEKTLGLVKQPA